MALSVPKTWVAGEILTHSDLNSNFDEIENKINGGLDNSNLTGTAGITNANLANPHYEMVVHFHVSNAMWTAAEDDDLVDIASFPDDINAESYTIVAVNYVFRCHITAATAGAAFALDWGYFNAGAWTQVSRIVNSTDFPAGATSLSAAAALNTTTVVTNTAQRRFFALVSTDVVEAAGTRPFADAEEFLNVAIKLKRTNGLRS